MKPRAALIDLYGTILVRPNHENPVKTIIKALGFTGHRYDQAYEAISTRYDVKSAADIVTLLAPQRRKDFDTAYYDQLLEDAIKGTVPVPEAKEVLGALQAQGVLLGAVSNTAAPLKRPFYDHGIDKYMTTAVFSCDVRYRKPHDMIYRIAFDKLQKAAEQQSGTLEGMVLSADAPLLPSHRAKLAVKPLDRDEVVVFGDSHLKDYRTSRRAALPALVIDRKKGMDLYNMLDVFCNGNTAAHAEAYPDASSARISLR